MSDPRYTSYTFRYDVNYSTRILGYPVLESSIPFSLTRCRAHALQASKLKLRIQETYSNYLAVTLVQACFSLW